MKLSYKVQEQNEYSTIKEVLKIEFSISDRLLLKLKKLQKITLNNNLAYAHTQVKTGDLIECDLNYAEDNSNIVPVKMNLDIIYEDEGYLIVDKPCGIPVHPSINHFSDSLSNGIRYYFDKIGLHKKIRPVNRLDKDTTGLVIFAKNEYIQECLVRQMQSKDFVKKYIAIVENHLEKSCGTIEAPIARKEKSIIERCIRDDGENAITHYRVLTYDEINKLFSCKDIAVKPFDIVECILETGRTHQIRVHFAYIGHPLLGDTLYGNSSTYINRQALHCYFLSFIHPISKTKVEYFCELPDDMQNIL